MPKDGGDTMKRWVNGKTLSLIWNVVLILLLAGYLFRLFLPTEVGEADPSAMTQTSSGGLLIVTPGKTLVGIGDGGGAVPYLLRRTVMDQVRAVASYEGANMAIDLEGRLWGWRGSFAPSVFFQALPDRPTQLLEGAREVAVGGRFAAVITQDEELLILGGGGDPVPRMEGYRVKVCRFLGDALYVVTSDGGLYRFGPEVVLTLGGTGGHIADGVADVNAAEGGAVQCLMEDGTVRLLSHGQTLGEPIYEGARALCTRGLLNRDDELLVWRAGAQNSDAIILQPKDTEVATASSETLYLKNNGRLYWDGMDLPASVNTVSPIFRDLLCVWVVVRIGLWWGKGRREKRVGSAAQAVEPVAVSGKT